MSIFGPFTSKSGNSFLPRIHRGQHVEFLIKKIFELSAIFWRIFRSPETITTPLNRWLKTPQQKFLTKVKNGVKMGSIQPILMRPKDEDPLGGLYNHPRWWSGLSRNFFYISDNRFLLQIGLGTQKKVRDKKFSSAMILRLYLVHRGGSAIKVLW